MAPNQQQVWVHHEYQPDRHRGFYTVVSCQDDDNLYCVMYWDPNGSSYDVASKAFARQCVWDYIRDNGHTLIRQGA